MTNHKLVAGVLLSAALTGFAAAGERERRVWIDGDGERVDLADLQDGETRWLGEGTAEVRATRSGDRITLEFGDPVQQISCSLRADDCAVILSEDRQLVVIQAGEAAASRSEVMVLGDGSQDGRFVVTSERGDAGRTTIHVQGDGGPAEDGVAVEVLALDGSVLRCPEGDTTMRLPAEDEGAGPYRCPRHGLELVKERTRPRALQVITREPRRR